MKDSILLTGSSGFLGKILHAGLQNNFQITTLGRTNKSNIACDLVSQVPSFEFAPDYVIHAAGHAHTVPSSEKEKKLFMETNFKGTENLLTGLNNLEVLPKAFVFISSVAVYGLKEGRDIKEDHIIAGETPYSKSKIMAEQIVTKWGDINEVIVGILRLPLICGPNPPGNLGKMINLLKKGIYPRIGDGSGQTSMVYGPDISKILPTLFRLGGTYNLTDGYHPSFKELEDSIIERLKTGFIIPVPILIATGLAKLGDLIGPSFPIDSSRLSKISKTLTFDDTKARETLDWRPRKVLNVISEIVK